VYPLPSARPRDLYTLAYTSYLYQLQFEKLLKANQGGAPPSSQQMEELLRHLASVAGPSLRGVLCSVGAVRLPSVQRDPP